MYIMTRVHYQKWYSKNTVSMDGLPDWLKCNEFGPSTRLFLGGTRGCLRHRQRQGHKGRLSSPTEDSNQWSSRCQLRCSQNCCLADADLVFQRAPMLLNAFVLTNALSASSGELIHNRGKQTALSFLRQNLPTQNNRQSCGRTKLLRATKTFGAKTNCQVAADQIADAFFAAIEKLNM